MRSRLRQATPPVAKLVIRAIRRTEISNLRKFDLCPGRSQDAGEARPYLTLGQHTVGAKFHLGLAALSMPNSKFGGLAAGDYRQVTFANNVVAEGRPMNN